MEGIEQANGVNSWSKSQWDKAYFDMNETKNVLGMEMAVEGKRLMEHNISLLHKLARLENPHYELEWLQDEDVNIWMDEIAHDMSHTLGVPNIKIRQELSEWIPKMLDVLVDDKD